MEHVRGAPCVSLASLVALSETAGLAPDLLPSSVEQGRIFVR